MDSAERNAATRLWPLLGAHVVGMCDDDDVRADVIGRLFYLITAAAEDAAAMAGRSQGTCATPAERKIAAAELGSSGEMIELLASVIELL